MVMIANAQVGGQPLVMVMSAQKNNMDVQTAMKTRMVIGVL